MCILRSYSMFYSFSENIHIKTAIGMGLMNNHTSRGADCRSNESLQLLFNFNCICIIAAHGIWNIKYIYWILPLYTKQFKIFLLNF